MTRTIDSLSPRDEELRSKPASQARADGLVSKPISATAPNPSPAGKSGSPFVGSGKTNPSQGDKTDTKSKTTHKRHLFYKLGALVLLISLVIIGWQYWGRDFLLTKSNDPNIKPVAKVSGSYITQKQFDDAVKDKQKLNKAMFKDKSDSDALDEAYNDLILEKALKQEAIKHNLSINDQDIDAQVKKANQNKAKLIELGKSNGVSSDTMFRWYRIHAYQEKLAVYLLDTRDVRQYAIRWDYGPTGTDIVDKGELFTAYQNQVKEKLRQVVEVPLKQGKKFDDFKARIDLNLDQDGNEYKPADVLTRSILMINKTGNKVFEDGEKDWAAIEKLNTVNQFSEIVRSDGGYFAIYQLLGRNNGNYASWDDYTNAVRRNTKKFVKADYSKLAIIETAFESNQCHKEVAGLFNKALNILGVGRAEAIACNSNHLNRFKGHVQDQLSNNLSGVTVKIEQRIADGSSLCGGSATGNFSTDAAGNWITNYEWSCFTKWRAVYTKNNCETIVKDILNPGTNGGEVSAGTVTLTCSAAPTNIKAVVAFNVNCETDTIDGYAYDLDMPYGTPPSSPNVFGFYGTQTAVGFIYSGNPYNGFSISPDPATTGEPCPFVGCNFVSTVPPYLPGPPNPPGYDKNPYFYANQDANGNVSSTGHNFHITGLLGLTAGTPKRNLKDGNTYGYLAYVFDVNGGGWGPGDGQQWTSCKYNTNFNVTGDKTYDAPPAPAPDPLNEIRGGVVWNNKPTGTPTTSIIPASTNWQLNSLNRTTDNVISADPTTNWEPYAYTICIDGTSTCHNPANKVFSTSVNIQANFLVQGGPEPHIRWYYRPLPANLTAKAVLDDGTNPCTKPTSDYRHQLCNAIGFVGLGVAYPPNSEAGLQAKYNRAYKLDTGYVSMNNANSEASLSNLYPWYYNIYTGGTPPAGFTISKYELCDASNNCTALAANFVVYPNDNRVIKITYTLAKPTILSSKIAPGNFTYWQQGSSLSTNIGSVAISNIANIWPCNTSLSDHWTGPADFCSQVDYGGQKTIDLTAPEGWEVRGYSFCDHTWWWNCGTSTDDAVAASAADITNGTSDHKIILNNNADKSTMQIIIGVNGSGLFTVAGKTIAGGNNIGFRYYFKPKPVSVKGRVLIDMQGGNAQANSDLNPCTSALKASSNYKTQLCNVKVRAIRMNSAGTTDNFAGSDIDPVAGNIISCSSSLLYQDFVPQRPGYNYSFVKNYYCAGSDASPSANLDGATPYIQVGKTWDAAGGVSDNTDPNESNLAIFRNLYPGKYRLQYIDTPTYNGEQAYDDQVSVCQPNSDNCSNAVAPSEPLGICPGTNWRQTYPEWNGVFHNEACTNSSGSSDNIPRTQFQCSPVPNVWPTNGTPPGCIALKSPRVGFDVPGAVGNFMVNPLNQSNPPNMYREANILFTPKFKIINSTNTTVLCNKVSGKAIYMPNPTSSVSVYLRFDNFDLRGSTSATIHQPTNSSNDFTFDIPTYNDYYASGVNWNDRAILKDGQSRNLRVFAEFPDDDLKVSYPDIPGLRPKTENTPGWKYSPQQIDDGTLRHKCVNSADCSAFSGYNLTYLDQDDTSYKITMRMTNTGQSLWMWRFNDSGFDRTTGHNLSVTAATTSAGWGINYPTLPDGTHVISSSPDGVQTVAGDNYIDYTVTVVPPPDGGSNAVLEFVMNATYSGNPTDSGPFPNPLPPAWQCKTKVEIRQSYKPWLRAQNGNVSALSTLMNQPKAGRGTYKAQTPTRTGDVYPKKGTIDWQTNIGYPNNPTAQGKADINLHAQYSVLAAVNNVTTNRFCSSNAYDFGRDALPPSAYNPVTTSCNLLGYNLNLSDTLRADLSDVPQGTYNTIYDNAANLANPAGGKCDDSDMSSTTKNGPHELSPPNEYYRFDSRNPGPTLNAPTLDKFGIYPSLVRIKDTQPTPANVTRPCPTIFNFGNTLGSTTLPTFVFAGRSTLVIDGDLNIVGDVKYDNSALGASIYQYSGLLEDDQAALNFLPNLGVIVKGDIIISDNVKEISGDYFATGKIRTCESYNNPGNGSNQPGNSVGQTLKIANSEEVDTVTKKLAPYRDDPDSARCKQKLVVHGTLAATRFNLGRNYLDFGGIATRINLNQPPSNLLPKGKFCVDNIGIPSVTCPIDFDNPGINITQSEGYPQSYYYGGPAEDIVGNGLSLIYPPPGFIDTASGNLNKPQYLDATSAPRF